MCKVLSAPPYVVRSVRVIDQEDLAESAAFFSESMIREIMTGTYLKRADGRLKKACVIGRWDLHENATDR